MGKDSKIAWTNHTFNPWWGCKQVSPGCDHCYAMSVAARYSEKPLWNNDERRIFPDKHWNQVLSWNQQAKQTKEPIKVFCGSMCDIFEENPVIGPQRERLWKLILDTPNLIWLLLTKRPQNISRLAPLEWVKDCFPPNVWLGITIEEQRLAHRAKYFEPIIANTFVSAEPLIGALSLSDYINLIGWVIVGGESGPRHRPMQQWWMDALVDQCQNNDTPVFVKQLGGHPDKRDDPDKYPQLTPREFPDFREPWI